MSVQRNARYQARIAMHNRIYLEMNDMNTQTRNRLNARLAVVNKCNRRARRNAARILALIALYQAAQS